MGTFAARDRARWALARLAEAELDNDSFRREAAVILGRAVGFDGWCWLVTDPVAGLPTRELGENMVVDQDMRRFLRLQLAQGAPQGAPPVTVLSADTGGDLRRDLIWREMFGPAGAGDKLHAALIASGTCWGHLHVDRDGSSGYFTEGDAELVADVAPLLAGRLRKGMRLAAPSESGPGDESPAEPGTIIVDNDLSLVAATEDAWRWIQRLGLPRLNDAEPLPGVIYVLAMHAAASPAGARMRLQATDGRWAVIRAAPLTTGSATSAGYAVTVEPAAPQDLAPLLMRAWDLTPRERQVAGLVIDGLSSEDIARALYISVHTVRGHLKTIFAKLGVSRHQDLIRVLAPPPP